MEVVAESYNNFIDETELDVPILEIGYKCEHDWKSFTDGKEVLIIGVD